LPDNKVKHRLFFIRGRPPVQLTSPDRVETPAAGPHEGLFIMTQKKEIRAKEFVADMNAGMTDSQLMDKYKISSTGLQSVFRKLVGAHVLTADDLRRRTPLYEDTATLDFDKLQFANEEKVSCLVPVYEASDPDRVGSICEISSKDLTISGLDAAKNDLKIFVVLCDDFFQIDSFELEARCKWRKIRNNEEGTLAAFEITDIADRDRHKLAALIRAVHMQD
jgi:hypothetical protein